MKKYDAIIIGFGKGGKTLAGFLANKGQRVAVIEKSDKMYGGTCKNVGCIPSKSLEKNAEKIENKSFSTFEEKERYYRDSIQKKEKLIAALRGKNYEMLASRETITIYDGIGSFLSNKIVNIKEHNGNDIQIEGDKIFINTGSTTVIPDIEGLRKSKHILTSTSAMNLEKLPEKLIIIGAGYIGLEFASTYTQFGSEVTVIDNSDSILQNEESEIADRVKGILESKGVKFVLGVKVEQVKDSENGVTVKVRNKQNEILEIEGCKVLAAIGRKANTEDLELERAGIKTDEKGAIIVNDKLETTSENIWAMGDVKGGLQFTYISLDDFRIIRDNVYGNGDRSLNDRNVIPYSIFIDIPLSRVGITEKEALQKGYNIKIGKLEAMTIPKGKIEGKSEGLLKVIIDTETNKILGATLLCYNSYEVINIIALAMKAGQPYQLIRDMIFTHPTMSEVLNDLFGSVK